MNALYLNVLIKKKEEGSNIIERKITENKN